MLPSAIVSAKDTLQKGNSEQQSQMNVLTLHRCLLYIDIWGPCWNNLHKQHLQWSNGNEKEHFSSTFCLVNSASQSNYSVRTKNRLQPLSWAQDPHCFKAMAGLACWIEESLSPLTVIWWWWIFCRTKERTRSVLHFITGKRSFLSKELLNGILSNCSETEWLLGP